MRRHRRYRGAGLLCAVTVSLLVCTAAPVHGGHEALHHQSDKGATRRINDVLHSPEVAARINAWGLSTADVQHDVDAMDARERTRLAELLTRRWQSNPSHSETDLQAQFLVTMSLLRESTLFASIISTRSSILR